MLPMQPDIEIRETSRQELSCVTTVLQEAFGGDEEAELVTALLEDPSAEPRLSLAAWSGDECLGHILFTRASLSGTSRSVAASILAPLAVIPRAQGRGIGGRLIAGGLARLSATDTELVFVLGYPDYYSRHGFVPAIPQGLTAPYPIASSVSDAWMVQPLRTDIAGSLQGQVTCARALDKPGYWRE